MEIKLLILLSTHQFIMLYRKNVEQQGYDERSEKEEEEKLHPFT